MPLTKEQAKSLLVHDWCIAAGTNEQGQHFVEVKSYDHQGKKVRQRFYTEVALSAWVAAQHQS